jgi:serine/threonine protein kinase
VAETFDDPLKRYQIMDPLGRGGGGRTFRAIDRATAREVAVKVLSLRDTGGDWKRFDLFEREVAVLRTLHHPGIPRYLDSYASESTGDYFLVMELVEGQPLSRRIVEQQRLDAATLRDLLGQALSILEYLHGLSPPVIHRDIKPANLVLDRSGMLHLVDFGGVRKATQAEGGSTTVIGTFGYMAPEQLHGEAGPSTDLYALGATIVALHAGAEADRLPHDGQRIDLSALSLPPTLAPALERMLEPDPKLRVRTVAEVRKLLYEPARLPPGAPPRPTTMPAVIPEPPPPPVPVEGLRDLARVPAPLSVLVWIFSALATGGLTVFQVVMFPLIVQIARQFNRDAPEPKRQKLESDLRRFEQTVADARRSLSYVATHTHPIRDEHDAGRSDREKRR